jgi:hypothetical protein
MGSPTRRNVGESQSVLVVTDPIISTRTRTSGGADAYGIARGQRLEDTEQALLRHESLAYSMAAAVGWWWLPLLLAPVTYAALSGFGAELQTAGAPPLPELWAAAAVGGQALLVVVRASLKGRARMAVLLAVVVKTRGSMWSPSALIARAVAAGLGGRLGGESKRLVVESPWSQCTSGLQRL